MEENNTMNRYLCVVFVELSTQDDCHLFDCFLDTINYCYALLISTVEVNVLHVSENAFMVGII